MPKDISPSSSEDEAENGDAEPATETQRKTTRYKCPADFVSFRHVPCSSTLADSLKSNGKELWLIQAPGSFDPESLGGVRVPLSGLRALQVPSAGSGGQIFSLLASDRGPSQLHLLTGDERTPGRMVFAPAFSGLLNVHESYGGGGAARAPLAVPAAPPPSIPAGLKQRFHPFGSRTPTLTCVAEDETDAASFGPSSTTLRPLVAKRFVDEGGRGAEDEEEEDDEGRRRKRKKRKKDKRIKTEEVVTVKQEPADDVQEDAMTETAVQEDAMTETAVQEDAMTETAVQEDAMTETAVQEEEHPAEKRRRKKKKKDREREEVEEGLEPSVKVEEEEEEVQVKLEPVETPFGDVTEASGKKKKKKKKKSKTRDD